MDQRAPEVEDDGAVAVHMPSLVFVLWHLADSICDGFQTGEAGLTRHLPVGVLLAFRKGPDLHP